MLKSDWQFDKYQRIFGRYIKQRNKIETHLSVQTLKSPSGYMHGLSLSLYNGTKLSGQFAEELNQP